MITVVGSMKGGSGKSTVTFNLAVWLSLADVPVKVIDLDPQATLQDVAEVRDEERYEPAVEVTNGLAFESSLQGWDGEVLVDVGTSDMEALKRAIRLADRVLVPVAPSQADIWSTQRFIRFVQEISSGGQRREVIAFINRADTHHAVRETDETAAALVALPGVKFVKRRLSQRTVYRRSFSEGLAVFELESKGKAANELISLAALLYPHLVK